MADYSDAATKVANEIVSDLQTFLTKVGKRILKQESAAAARTVLFF